MQLSLQNVVEALIFAAPEPMTLNALRECIAAKTARDADEAEDDESPENLFPDLHIADVEAAITSLNQQYESQQRAFRIVEGPAGWRIFTHPDFAEWVRELFPGVKPTKLSAPALETLAIIAYRQPITKADVEAVRGVSVDGVLNKIIDRGLVQIVGRAEVLGRPLLYGTTDQFMEHFGIKDIEELPNAAELRTIALPGADGESQNPRETEQQLVFAATEPETNED